jgi:hypothetical protein
MNREEFIEHMRQEIKEEGFMTSVKLAARIILRLNEKNLIDKINPERVLKDIEGKGIHILEYTNTQAELINRYKDLYYYNPNKSSK